MKVAELLELLGNAVSDIEAIEISKGLLCLKDYKEI